MRTKPRNRAIKQDYAKLSNMPAERPRPSFLRAMSQIRNLGAWTWHWMRAGEIGALDRNKAFDIAYVQHLLRRIVPKLESAGLSRELTQIESLDSATQRLMSEIDNAELPSPLVAQRVIVIIESVQVSLLHTLKQKLDNTGDDASFDVRSDANDTAIAAISDCDIASAADVESSTWESIELQIATLERRVAAAHQLLADAEMHANNMATARGSA